MNPSEQSHLKTKRIKALDALRGLIMVFMAIDHANHFIAQKHSSGEYWGGPFPDYQDGLSFLTRLITHLSAPGFFFLMGVGMLLFAKSRRKRGWPEIKIIGHFLLRGALLIALQLFVVNPAWELSPGGWVLETYIGVLFALGGTMILGSLLLWLKPQYLFVLTVALLYSDAALPLDPAFWGQNFSLLERLTSIPGGDLSVWVNYPILPWLPVVTFGMLFGQWLCVDRKKTLDNALWIGVSFLVAFLILRSLGGFGNIRPRIGESWVGFFNLVKYPPSLNFLLITMGINLIFLSAFSKVERNVLQPLTVYGQVPLFFYLAHLYLYVGLGYVFAPTGTSILKMLPFWILGLGILYPLCLWFGRLKRSDGLVGSLLHYF